MKFAERKCQNLKMGKIPYSPTINKSELSIKLWQAVITKKKRLKYSSRKLRRLEKKTKLERMMNKSLEQAQIELKESQKHFWECKKQSKLLCKTFLEKRQRSWQRKRMSPRKQWLNNC